VSEILLALLGGLRDPETRTFVSRNLSMALLEDMGNRGRVE
jgi:hypothetical protein